VKATDAVTAEALHILQHSLGLDRHGRGEAYRNHFVTGPGSDDFAWCERLAAAGLMHAHGEKGALTGGDHLFTVTQNGRDYVREFSPKPPKLTRSQRRYRQYLQDDSGLPFGEWLTAEWAR
jgi:hypothetical protein